MTAAAPRADAPRAAAPLSALSVATRVEIDAEHPWPGLGAFDEGAERFFNGRDEEAGELRRLVLQAPLTVLFGASGLGKTSLLQAGLFPRLRRDHVLPVYARLDFRGDADRPLVDQLGDALRVEIERRGVDAPAPAPGESLWLYLHRSELELWSAENQLLTPLFVLDQFEEVFTLGAAQRERVAQLRRDLSDLVENRVPLSLAQALERDAAVEQRYHLDAQRYRVLLSFREDFLPAVEGWKRDVPSILRNRLRLRPMRQPCAVEAVMRSAPELVDAGLAERIAAFVAAADDHLNPGDAELDDVLVEPALLSLVCHGLNAERLRRRMPRLDARLLDETAPSIVSDFYERALDGMRDGVRRFVEAELITERGFRKACDVDDARVRHGITHAELVTLVDRRLLRIEPTRGSESVELTHDLLTGVAKRHRERERELARERERFATLRRRVVGALVAVVILLVGSAVWTTLEVRQHREADRVRREADDRRREATEARLRRDSADAARARYELAQRNLTFSASSLAFERDRMRDAQRDLALKQRNIEIQQRNLEIERQARELARRDSVVRVQEDRLRVAARTQVESAGGRLLPFDSFSHLDLFDVRGGRLARRAGTPTTLFGDSSATSPEPGLQPFFYRDEVARPGVRDTVEWSTTEPVTLGSVALFAQHDGEDGVPPTGVLYRAFLEMELKVREEGGDGQWKRVAYLRPALPYAGPEPFADPQPYRSLGVCFPMRPVTQERGGGVPPQRAVRARQFRLEVVHATFNRAPRIVELDGYPDATCSAPASGFAVLASSDSMRAYAASAAAISLVLVEWDRRWGLTGTALQYLLQTRPEAWNQYQVVRARAMADHVQGAWAPFGRALVARLDSLVPGRSAVR